MQTNLGLAERFRCERDLFGRMQWCMQGSDEDIGHRAGGYVSFCRGPPKWVGEI